MHRTLTTSNVGDNKEQQELSFIVGGNRHGTTTSGRQYLGFLQNKTYFYHKNQQLHSLVFNQGSRKLMFSAKTCIRMFIAALFIIKTWKKPRCPSVGKWINWSLQTKDYWMLI